MFQQLLTPVGHSVTLSFFVAILPIATVLILLGVFKRPAWQAAFAGLVVGLIIAITTWQLPAPIAFSAAANGAIFALWPVMWIVINALFLYNIAVSSGRFDAFRAWIIQHLPNDRRVVLVAIGFCFGAPALEALVFVLIFNTTPVAFGALGAPVTVLGAVTGLPAVQLAQMVGRQLPLMAAFLPFYVMALYGRWRSIRALWPMLLVAGLSFGISQFAASNYLDYTLTDVFAALGSLAVTLLFLQIWKPATDPQFAIDRNAASGPTAAASGSTAAASGLTATAWAVPRAVPAWQGWLPWLIVTATVIVWTFLKVATLAQHSIPWPGLDKAVSSTLYNGKPYAAMYAFQPLGTGTAILLAALITAPLVGVSLPELGRCAVRTIRQIWQAVLTVMLIPGFTAK